MNTYLAGKKGFYIFVFTIGLALVSRVQGESSEHDTSIAAIKAYLNENLPTMPVAKIEPSKMMGMYEISLSTGEVLMSDATGEYIIVGGELFNLKGPRNLVNLSQERLSKARVDLLAKLDAKTMVVYKPKSEVKETLFVFTDVDCGYCQKFHLEIPALTAKGVEVRYLAWPRAGLESPTGTKMKQVWCADDQLTAMDFAKARKKLTSKDSCETPIQEHLQVGIKMGVKGTPAVFLADGKQVGGYREAADLLQELKL